jgi:hypothetical protein
MIEMSPARTQQLPNYPQWQIIRCTKSARAIIQKNFRKPPTPTKKTPNTATMLVQPPMQQAQKELCINQGWLV